MNDTVKTEINFDRLNTSHLQAIYRLTQQMAHSGDAEELLQLILFELMAETGAEVGAFIYYDAQYDQFIPRTIRTQDGRSKDEIEFSHTVFQNILKNKEAVLTFDTRTDRKYSDKQSVIINKIYAILAFPLIIDDQLYGILYFDSRRNRQSFNETSRQFLSFFSAIASLALEQVLTKRKIEKENIQLRKRLDDKIEIPEIIGESEEIKKLFRLISRVAKTDASVIISGENGTGKDLVAKAIHNLSNRKDKLYIAQYIGNIPATILESELFGYKKGAFTGADKDKIGLFEAADGGTLFLDEIGDLSPDLQTKLLRVLENKEIKRLGENTVRYVDVRIIAATNKDLVAMVKKGSFREDLYYRLNVISIKVPPLRQRKTDIPLLVNYFLKNENPEQPLEISKKALRKLISYDWPGNVRQLSNIIQRACILAGDNIIREEDIQFDDLESQAADTHFEGTLEELKNSVIAERIKMFDGNKTRAAKSLNISLRSLQAKAKELGL